MADDDQRHDVVEERPVPNTRIKPTRRPRVDGQGQVAVASAVRSASRPGRSSWRRSRPGLRCRRRLATRVDVGARRRLLPARRSQPSRKASMLGVHRQPPVARLRALGEHTERRQRRIVDPLERLPRRRCRVGVTTTTSPSPSPGSRSTGSARRRLGWTRASRWSVWAATSGRGCRPRRSSRSGWSGRRGRRCARRWRRPRRPARTTRLVDASGGPAGVDRRSSTTSSGAGPRPRAGGP